MFSELSRPPCGTQLPHWTAQSWGRGGGPPVRHRGQWPGAGWLRAEGWLQPAAPVASSGPSVGGRGSASGYPQALAGGEKNKTVTRQVQASGVKPDVALKMKLPSVAEA